jgi:proteasome lid subunit RPN8/RPN11
VIIPASLLETVANELRPNIRRHHEGIVYLLGRTSTSATIVIAISRPESRTTRGSFDVGKVAMAQTVRAAANAGLQVVGQLHSHPGTAFHSNGDVAGARIRYPGYVSIVVPNFGSELPRLGGAVCYVFDTDRGFCQMEISSVRVVPSTVP